MALAKAIDFLSVEEYLEGELHNETRHEYLAGKVYAMVGASDRHNTIAINMVSVLRPNVLARGCHIFMSDLKVRLNIDGDDIFYYPDLMICCDPDDQETYYRRNPCGIIEILSDSTERIDRREKLLAYTRLPSVAEYLLVSQDERKVEIHRKSRNWKGEILTRGEIRLECVEAALPMEDVYAGI